MTCISSEAERLPLSELLPNPEVRKRYFIRSGGRTGVQVITSYDQGTASMCCPSGDLEEEAPDAPCVECAKRNISQEEKLAALAAVRLSETCLRAIQTHAEANERKANRRLTAGEKPLASSEYMMESMRRAVVVFLTEHDAYVQAKKSRKRNQYALQFP